MTSRILNKSLSVVVGGAGILLFDWTTLLRFNAAWITLKFPTAIMLILSGIIAYIISCGKLDEVRLVVLSGATFISWFYCAAIPNTNAQLFIQDKADPNTIILGMPSLMSLLGFFLVGMAGVFSIIHARNRWVCFTIVGVLLSLMGAGAVTGYMFNSPMMCYYYPNKSNVMSFPEALLFLLLGIIFWRNGAVVNVKDENQKNGCADRQHPS